MATFIEQLREALKLEQAAKARKICFKIDRNWERVRRVLNEFSSKEKTQILEYYDTLKYSMLICGILELAKYSSSKKLQNARLRYLKEKQLIN